MEILKDDILQLNFHTFIGSLAQFEELHGSFVNLGIHLPQNIILPKCFDYFKYFHVCFFLLEKMFLQEKMRLFLTKCKQKNDGRKLFYDIL